jgi:ceramide glucosyltransferase
LHQVKSFVKYSVIKSFDPVRENGRTLTSVFWFLAAAAVITSFYHLIATVAALKQLWRRPPAESFAQPISLLKPVRGLDPYFLDAIRSHAVQEYPAGFEILFGVADPRDPAVAAIEQLIAEYPQLAIRIVFSATEAPNAKVGVLIDLAHEARHPLLLVNDSDILVPPGYLSEVVAPLADDAVGIVTCLYRARGDWWPARWEALGIAVDFAPSVLVAPLVGIREFGLGATLVFRRRELEAIGGFATLAPYLADDYQLARHITRLGPRAYMSRVVVDTALGDDTWAGVWSHQVRWARTIRVSRGDGYLGLPVTHAGVWALLALLCGYPALALAVCAVRWLSAWVAGVAVLRSPVASFGFWLAPLWDCWAFVVWMAGLAGNTVEWRDKSLQLDREGRITSCER